MSARDSDISEECPACQKAPGTLCIRCQRAALPQLAQPAWVRLIGKQATRKERHAESPEARKVRERKERKAARKLLRRGALGLLLSAELKAA